MEKLLHLNGSIKIVSCLLLCFSLTPLLAQEHNLDKIDQKRSLWLSDEQSNTSDSQRLAAANSLRAHYASSHYDSLWLICDAMEARGIETNNKAWIANAWHGRGKYYLLQGNIDSAIQAYLQVLNLVEQESDVLMTRTLGALGRIEVNRGRIELAINYLQRAIELAHLHGHQRYLGPIHLDLADAYHRQGRYLEEIESLHQARLHGIPNQQFYASMKMARLFLTLELPEEAEIALSEVLELKDLLENPAFLVRTNALRIEMVSNIEEAQKILNASVRMIDSFQLTEPALFLYIGATQMYLEASELDSAMHYALLARAMEKKLTIQPGSTYAIPLLANTHYLLGSYQTSLELCRSVQTVIEQEPSLDLQETLYNLLSKNFEALNQLDSALHYVRKLEQIEKTFDSNALAKSSMITYLRLNSSEEREAMQAAKEVAERQALLVEAESKLVRWVLTLLSTILAIVAVSYYLFYKHRNRTAIRLEQLNQVLDDERQKLQSSNQKLRRFSGVVSHDILSILDFILSAGNVLVKPSASRENLEQYATLTKQSSRQLKDYCLGLLREALGEHSSDKTFTNPMPIVQRVLANFDTLLKEAGIQVTLEPLSPTLLPAVTVEQIFINLVSNVLRYGSSAPEPHLRIAEERDDNGRYEWVIEDNGPGIPLERMEVIFQRNQLNGSNSKGQNLGLSLLLSSLQDYGAELRVEARNGGGARFIVSLR